MKEALRCCFTDSDYLVCDVYQGAEKLLSFARRRLVKYWPSARRRIIDGAFCKILDEFLLLHFSEGSKQGGCLALIDINRNKVIHVSSGAFLTNVMILDNAFVFCVLNIAYWGHSSTWHAEWRKFSSKSNVWCDDNVVCRVDIPHEIQFGGRYTEVIPSLTREGGYNVVISGGEDRYEAVFDGLVS